MAPKNEANGMLHGTLDALVLKTLTWGVRHGYGIAKWIEEATDEAVPIEEGSLSPASELGRKAKFYRITPKGRRQLAADTAQWARFATAVSKVLLPA